MKEAEARKRVMSVFKRNPETPLKILPITGQVPIDSLGTCLRLSTKPLKTETLYVSRYQSMHSSWLCVDRHDAETPG